MKLNYNCPNPACKKSIGKEVDPKASVVDIECPHCGRKFQGKVPKMALDNSQKEVLPAGKSLKVNKAEDLECPHCKRTTHVEAADKPGMKIVKCQNCKGPIEVNVLPMTQPPPKVKYPFRGKLQISQRIFFKKDIPLRVGLNVIGRTDRDTPSDIMLDDQYASRRSVEIEVEVGERGGFFFRFRVRKATNPVLVNNRRIEPGCEILLNYGDIITIGQTKLRFDKIV